MYKVPPIRGVHILLSADGELALQEEMQLKPEPRVFETFPSKRSRLKTRKNA